MWDNWAADNPDWYVIPAKRLFLAFLAVVIPLGAAFGEDTRGYRLLDFDGHAAKWGKPSLGTAATVTYAIAIESSSASGIENCRETKGVNALLANSHLALGTFQQALDNAFKMWSDVSNVHFVRATPEVRADLVITAEAVPDGIAYSDVTPKPVARGGTIAQAVVCLNPQVQWTTTDKGTDSYRLFYVLAHEIGHTIGLDHPSPSGELMSFEYSRTLQSLQPGDIAGAVVLYGAAHQHSIALNAR